MKEKALGKVEKLWNQVDPRETQPVCSLGILSQSGSEIG